MIGPHALDKMKKEIEALEEKAKTDSQLAAKLAQARDEARAENERAVAKRLCGPGELAILHRKCYELGLI